MEVGGTQAVNRERLLTSREVAEWLAVSYSTLDTWCFEGTGPRYHKVGRNRRFRASDVEAWLVSRVRASGGAL